MLRTILQLGIQTYGKVLSDLADCLRNLSFNGEVDGSSG